MKISPNVRSPWRLTLAVMIAIFAATALPKAVHPVAAQSEPPRTVFVHLFEWKWLDIAEECENFLGPKGFSSVQVSPPNEHAWLGEYSYPWWQRYQSVSYQLQSRSGTRAEFIEMVQRCDAVGVGIYVDAVINHMTGVGSGTGSAGSSFSAYSYPIYSYADFHHCGLNGNDDIVDYSNRWEVQNCELVNLADLDTGATYVRNTLVAYLQDLVNIGVAGFRVDAAKHIDTNDIHAIFDQVEGDFYVYQEVIEASGEPITGPEYFQNGDVTEFDYSKEISRVFYEGQLSWLEQFGEVWGFMDSANAVVFVDNHDNQRGHGGGGHIVTHQDGTLYDLANVYMLAWPYGYPRIMSSYQFTDSDQGPPSDGSGNTYSVYSDYNDPNSYDCFGSNWVCEHRWQPIANMVEFHNVTSSAFYVTNWWDNDGNQIAFSRGSLGFVAINKESTTLNHTFQTGMAAGVYCNVIDGQLSSDGSSCSGSTVTVNSDGTATLSVAPWTAIAIHVNDKVSGGGYAQTYPQVYFRGTANSWSTTAMALVGDYTWQIDVTFSGASDDRFKFDIYGDWSLNFGDTDGNGIADQSGSDITITNGAGDYTITFNDLTKAYSVSGGGGGSDEDIATTFSVSGAYTSWGQNVYVVGNVAALGNWDPCSAVLLSPTAYPTWTGTVNLPASTAIAYKYIKYYDGDCASVTWQDGDNNTFTTPSGGSVTRSDAW